MDSEGNTSQLSGQTLLANLEIIVLFVDLLKHFMWFYSEIDFSNVRKGGGVMRN
jgi:hypothetical protein